MFIFALLVTVVASTLGVTIAHWTHKEMKQYLKWIKYCYLVFLLMFIVTLFVKCAGCLLSVASILIGIAIVLFFDWFILKHNFGESSAETWLLVGIGMAAVFNMDARLGFIAAYLVSLHNMFYASLNVMQLRGKSLKKFAYEQILYVGAALVAFYFLSGTHLLGRSMFSFAMFGIMLYLFAKKAIKLKK